MNVPTVNSTPEMALYEAMVSAIAECAKVDEVKTIHDKAIALEVYYRQARNKAAEIEACNIRLRAERRAGELLKDLARAETSKGGSVKSASKPLTPKSPYAEALEETGMSRQTAHQFQKLAEVPKDEFEAALSGESKASRSKILKPSDFSMSREPLWVWGRIKDFHRDNILKIPAPELAKKMTDPMRAEVSALLPDVRTYLAELEKSL